MKVCLLTTTDELLRTFALWSAKADDIRVVTAWATTECLAFSQLTDSKKVISTLVVGLDFYQTGPLFLESFRSIIRIGEAFGRATFHPKVYLFCAKNFFCCILGSSNFTGGGFGNNTEVNLCVTGKVTDPFFGQVKTFIDREEAEARQLTSPEIDDYRRQFNELAAMRKRLKKFEIGPGGSTKVKAKKAREAAGEEPPEQLNKTWAEFAALIIAQEKRDGLILRGTTDKPGYLETAETCQDLFREHRKLRDMQVNDRQFIGGTVRVGGWFGSMIGNGKFKQRLNVNPGSLDEALDNIPMTAR